MQNHRTMQTTRVWQMAILFFFVSASLVWAQTGREIQERMRERLPEIDALKKEQVVGESQEGYLESLKTLPKAQQVLVREENKDRKKVYRLLADRSGTTPEQVGEIRARQIAERSAPGVMVEDEHGEWAEKR